MCNNSQSLPILTNLFVYFINCNVSTANWLSLSRGCPVNNHEHYRNQTALNYEIQTWHNNLHCPLDSTSQSTACWYNEARLWGATAAYPFTYSIDTLYLRTKEQRKNEPARRQKATVMSNRLPDDEGSKMLRRSVVCIITSRQIVRVGLTRRKQDGYISASVISVVKNIFLDVIREIK